MTLGTLLKIHLSVSLLCDSLPSLQTFISGVSHGIHTHPMIVVTKMTHQLHPQQLRPDELFKVLIRWFWLSY